VLLTEGEKPMRVWCFVIMLVLLVTQQAMAENDLTFTAQLLRNDAGAITPTLAWGTEPAAVSCVATGPNWGGPKSPSGVVALPQITQSATYELECQWSPTDVVRRTVDVIVYPWPRPPLLEFR
jgi:hypothetical protein